MHVREGCSIAAMHRHRRAALREELRDGRSDTARAAGDPCHFPVQRFHAGTRAVRNTIGSVDSRPAPMATPIAINAICVGGLTVIRKTTPVRRNVLTVREAARRRSLRFSRRIVFPRRVMTGPVVAPPMIATTITLLKA